MFRVFLLLPVLCLAQDNPRGGDRFFQITNVWTLELRMGASEWRSLLSNPHGSVQGPYGRKSYCRADIFLNGEPYSNVAVRVKGGGTRSGVSLGRIPLRVDFEQQNFHGVKKISLNSNYYDDSCMRETLSYELFRQFNVPAPQCTYAMVRATAPGMFTNKYLGLYTLVEAVDKTFLKRNFKEKDGLLLKPNFQNHGFPKGKTWQECVRQLQPRTPANENQQERVLAFMKLVTEADNETFQKEIDSYVDIDDYLRFLVVNTALANLDSYLGMGKNYYIYLDSKTGKMSWIPWDLDLSFGGYFFCGTPSERTNLSIDNPSSVNDPLIKRLLSIPVIREKYHAQMRLFLETAFAPEKLKRDIATLEQILKASVKESPPGGNRQFHDGDMDIRQFVEKRIPSIQVQLDGKSNGDQPSFWNRFGR